MRTSARPTRRPIPPNVLARCAAAFRALAHPDRLRMVELLDDRPLSVGRLASRLGLPPAACSQHLSLLRVHGLLRAVRDGRKVLYEIADPSARTIIGCIRAHAARHRRGSVAGTKSRIP